MAHRAGKNKNKGKVTKPQFAYKGFNSNYWSSQDYNSRLYNYYRDIILKMAISRYKWVNLPKTCNERYLNWILATEGIASIAYPKKMKGVFFSTKAILKSQPNVYDEFSRWDSFGNNGWRFSCDATNGVLVWDNSTRYPILESIDLYATELVHVRMTKNMNRFHQQIPYILTGPNEKKFDMVNIMKQVAGGELAIIGNNGLDLIEPKTLDTGVPYIGSQLCEDELYIWSRIYTMLGVENSPFKAERQTEDEVRAQKSPAQLIRLSSLECLRKACDTLNNRFEKYLLEPISVVWNQDNESENYNAINNLKSYSKVLNGED